MKTGISVYKKQVKKLFYQENFGVFLTKKKLNVGQKNTVILLLLKVSYPVLRNIKNIFNVGT